MSGMECFLLFSGMSIRSKVAKLQREHGTIDKAENAFGLDVHEYMEQSWEPSQETLGDSSMDISFQDASRNRGATHHSCLTSELLSLSTSDVIGVFEVVFVSLLSQRANRDLICSLLDRLVKKLAESEGIQHDRIDTLVSTSVQAMKELHTAGHSPDLIGRFSECIANKRPGSKESLMPLQRMPFGLLKYQIEFFTSSDTSKVMTI